MSKAKKIERMKKEAALKEAQNSSMAQLSQSPTTQSEQNKTENVDSATTTSSPQISVFKPSVDIENIHPKTPVVNPFLTQTTTPTITKLQGNNSNETTSGSAEQTEQQSEPKEEILPEKRNVFLGYSVDDGETLEVNEAVDIIRNETPVAQPTQPKKKGMFDFLFGGSNKKAPAEKGLKNTHATVQETIPYISVYPNGIIETSYGVYTKSYLLNDVNFQTASDEEQEKIFTDYGNLLNSFGAEVKAEITVFNRNIDQEKFKENTLLKMKNDEFDGYREEYNKILLSKINEGRNNIIHEKYLTLAVEANGIDEAMVTFSRLDTDISARIKKINGVETFPMTIEERLAVLYDIYNLNSDIAFNSSAKVKGMPSKNFDLAWLKKQGISSKDIIAPSSMHFGNSNYFKIDETFARVLYIDNLPTFLSTDLIPEITSSPCNLLLSVHFDSMKQDKAVKLIRNQMVNINSNVVEAQKRASRGGYSAELISPELLKAQREAERIMSDMTSRNQKMFLMTMVVTVFAESLEELNKNTEVLKSVAQRFLCALKPLSYQQEPGFASSLPLASNQVYVQRLLTTETASLFMPFSAQELSQKNGMYYGLNAVSRNLLLFNRINSKNANGVILGTPGAGKSFSAKREMVNVFLGTDDDIYIIDPEREYTPLAALFNGQVVKIAAGSKTYINPLDMDLDYADDDDPITLKSDFIGSLCETIIGGRYGLAPIQKSVIDRCVRQVYQPYLAHIEKLKNKGVTFDKSAMPTLDDFYELLLIQPEPEAQNIALALELYCRGSLDTFAHKTNIETQSRFVVYDIKDIGSGMKEMGLQVCLNDIWNKIIENHKKGKRTWFYIDEFYLLTQTESSARFLQQIWKRARKWHGVPTGITQNVEDLLASKEARGIINNCDFVLMLNQAPLDRIELGHMLNISPAQMSYITNADAGQGLIYTSKYIVPFIDKFPSGNSLYKVMTTKPDEVDLSKVTL
jgi:type IV secretory pathway VirB4 component